MKVTEKKNPDGTIDLTAVAATAEVAQAFNAAHHSFLANMGLQVGPTQTPAQVAEEELGIVNLDAVSQQLAVDYLVPFAVDKRNLCPAFPPMPVINQMIKRGEPFEFQLIVTPKPDYELTSYEPVSVTVPALRFDEAMVDEQLRQVLESYATYVRCDSHPLGENDAARIKVEATQGGKANKNLSTDGRTYIMGMNLLPEGFEKNLLGMAEGDTKSFSFDIPGAEKGTDPIDCTVTVLECQCKKVPELTDEWVKQNIPMLPDAAALRASIREALLAQQQAQYREMQLSMVADELARRFEGAIADEVYESMRDTLMQNVKGFACPAGPAVRRVRGHAGRYPAVQHDAHGPGTSDARAGLCARCAVPSREDDPRRRGHHGSLSRHEPCRPHHGSSSDGGQRTGVRPARDRRPPEGKPLAARARRHHHFRRAAEAEKAE